MADTKKMKVLMGMINKGLRGGPPGHLPYLVEGLEINGVEVIQLIYGARLNDENVLEKTINLVRSIIELKRKIKQFSPDIIHLNSAFDFNSIFRDFVTLIFIKKYNIPIVVKTHGTNIKYLSGDGRFVALMRKKLFKWVDVFGVLSSEEADNFIKAGLPPKKVKQIKNIVNTEVIRNNKRLVELKDKLVMLFAARFVRQKGLLDVIEACDIINRAGRDFHLFCLGAGEDEAKAKKRVSVYKLEDKVTFTGFIPEAETKAYYAMTDIFVFPTYHEEGFPMALFQSVAGGAAIVTTKIRAAADYLVEPDNCLWVPPRNPRILADKLKQLMDAPDLCLNMKQNNIKLVEKFDKNTVAKEFIEIYHELL